MLKRCLIKMQKPYRKFVKKFFYFPYRMRLNNKTPTIISSDCIGGVICNNLGLRFNSPTVNLWFSKEDFYSFVLDLEGYLSCDLVEKVDSDETYPVGILTYNNKTVTVYFMHYKSFEEAKNKWDERKKRIDFSNVYIIQLVKNVTEEYANIFDALPYDNKMLIASNNPTNSKNIVIHEILSKEGYRPGEILDYKSAFTCKRYIDDINYVKFLNSRKVTKRK